ncbi:MAG: TolC family protein [Myxococcales bacterium]|nr:TolC family protein [Myxococcales bacterium]
MLVRAVLILVVGMITLADAPAEAQRPAKRTFRIMIVADGESELFAYRERLLKEEILEVLKEDADVVFATPRTETNWTYERAEAAVKEALGDRSVDVVIIFGPMSGVAVGRIEKLSRPVIIPYAAPKLQGLPQRGDSSGRRNLAYITGLLNFEKELRQLRDIVRYDRLALIVGEEVVAHLDHPEAPVQAASRAVGVETRLIVVEGGPEEALNAIPEDSDAVYIGPLFRWSDAEMQTFIDGINQQSLPSYAGDGVKWVERGALATMETPEDEIRRFRRVAIFAQRILLREQASTFPISFELRPQLVINMGTARAIGTWPRFAVMAEARVINDQTGTRGPLITLETAMADSVRANLDLMAAGIEIEASHEEVKVQRGRWLPAATAEGDFTVIDPDVATSFQNAQRQFTWGITGQQLLYSAGAQGALRSTRDRYRSIEWDYNSARLDTMLAGGESYLNVLRAKNNERVQRDNLKLTRKNLSLAETRNAIGVAGREEVFRWQTQIAESRSSVIQASATRNQAEIELNRVLNRPLEGPFQTPPEAEVRSVLPGSDPRVAKYFEDPWSFKVFREFMALEAVRNSPEIQSIDKTIAARTEILKAERRTLGIPDVAVVGGFTHIPYAGGIGSEQIDSSMTGFPGRQTFTWSVGGVASLVLLDGGSNYARIGRTFREIDRFETDRAIIAQRFEADVRSTLHQAGASFANIELSADAAEASARNLELVTDLYQRGAADIIQLVDAQNQALGAALAAANARYDFLIDGLRVQRAAGNFSLEGTEEERDDFLERLDAFAAQRKNRRRPALTGNEPMQLNPPEPN